MTALAVADPRPALPLAPGVVMTATALKIKDDLPFADWVTLGRQLGHLVNASAFAIGDWLEYGQFEYGRRYEDGIAATGLDAELLRDRQWVSSNVPLRSERLSWSHHRAVAALGREEQSTWLGRALDDALTVKQLRDLIRESRALPTAGRPQEVFEQLRFPADRAERWRQAAAGAGLPLDEWVGRVVDDALARGVDVALGEAA